MFLVGGGIIVHQFESLHHIAESIAETLHHIPLLGGLLAWCTPAVFDLFFGVFAGGLVVAVLQLTKWFFGQSSHPSPHGSNSVHE
jgi:predicted DNA repair protein MutK